MKNIFFIIIIVLATILVSFTTVKSKHNSNRQITVLRQTLKRATTKGYIFGHQDDTNYGYHWCNEEGRSDVKDVCGDYPGVIGFDLGHIELDSTKNLDNVPFIKIREEAIKQYQRGGIVTLSWHLNNPLTGGNAWDVSNDKVVSSILPGGKNHRMFQGWLKKVAIFINSIKTPNGTKVPILFRPWHENTGSWFWWGEKLCSPQDYKALWLMTEKTLKVYGVNNLLYVFSPGGGCSEEQYMERYPGDNYIDILGTDIYQTTSDESYTKEVTSTFDFLTKLGKEHNKLIAFTETGYVCIPEKNWWTKRLMPAIEKYPISYVLVWRNAYDRDNHFFAPYKGQKSADDFVEFYNSSKTLFVRDIQKLNK